MNKYISILRGINVSGKRKIKMKELKDLYEKLKFENVITYIQSGNVIFDSNIKDSLKLEISIEKEILKYYGFEVPTLVRTVKYLEKVFLNNPFRDKGIEDIAKLHVTFLSVNPSSEKINKIADVKRGNDEFVIKEDVIYLYCPDGYGKTKLTNTFFEGKLKISATTRNWKTVTKLLELTK